MVKAKKGKKVVRKKRVKVASNGVVHIHSTYNNTIVTITDINGNVVSWASAGRMGVKGSKKSTPFIASEAASAAAKEAFDLGMRNVEIKVKGPGAGREGAIRAVGTTGLAIVSIKDVTGIPHNGCRPPKKRRV